MKWLTLLCIAASALHADDWPQWLGPKRDGVWREGRILEQFPADGLKVRWRTPINAGYAGPAVAAGKVYVIDRSLHPKAAGPSDAFKRGQVPGTERVLCLNEADGKMLWQHEYDCSYNISYPAGPRATPLIDRDLVYTLGAEGDLICLSAESGKIVWARDFKKGFGIDAPLWGFSGHPLIEGESLFCLAGGTGSVAVAYNKRTGQELWRALSAKEPGYCPPTMVAVNGTRQLIIWHGESINALNPDTGKVLWTVPMAVRFGLSIATPRQDGNLVFISSFYNGPIMLRLEQNKPEPTVVWRGKSNSERNTDGLHALMSTPMIDAGHIYGVCSYGQLRCLKADTGERVWDTLKATTSGKEVRWANAFLIKNENRYFLANEKGELIIAQLTPEGYREVSRTHLLEPTNTAAGRDVVWSHPAFANRSIYARNDKEIVCASLSE